MKKVLAFLLAVLMVLSLVACASKNEPAKTEAPKTEEPAKTDETPKTESTDPIKVGYACVMSGANALGGMATYNAFMMAIEEINEAGGVLGRQLEVYAYDDKGTPEEAVKCVTRLIEEDKVDFIVGSFQSSNCLAVNDLIEEAGIPYCSTSGTSTVCEQGNPYVFRAMLCGIYMQPSVLNTCNSYLDVNSMMVCHTMDDYGITSEAQISDLCGKYNIEYMGAVSLQNGDPDITGQASKVAQTNPDALYLAMVEAEMPNVIKQLRAAGYEGWIVGEQGVGTANTEEVCGDAFDHLQFSCAFIIPEDPADGVTENLRVFFQKFYDKYGVMPASDCACRVYDGINLFKLAIENAGTVDKDAVAKAIYAIQGYEGLFGTYDFVAGGGTGEGVTEARNFVVYEGTRYILDDYLKLVNKA